MRKKLSILMFFTALMFSHWKVAKGQIQYKQVRYQDTISLWNGQFRVYGLTGKGGVHPEDLGLVSLVFEVRSNTTVARTWPGFSILRIVGPNNRKHYDKHNQEQPPDDVEINNNPKSNGTLPVINKNFPKPSEVKIMPFSSYFGAPPPNTPMLMMAEFDPVWLEAGLYKIFVTMDCPSTPNGKPESYCLLLTVLPTRLSKQQQEQAVHFLSSVSNKYDEKLKTKAIWDITLLNKASFRKNLKPSLGSSQTQGLTLHGLIMASYKQSYKMLCIPGLKDWKISSSFELFLSENIATIYARDKRYALALMANSLPQINEATRKKLNLKAVSNPEFKNVFKQSLLH